jgi:hypothetical protein
MLFQVAITWAATHFILRKTVRDWPRKNRSPGGMHCHPVYSSRSSAMKACFLFFPHESLNIFSFITKSIVFRVRTKQTNANETKKIVLWWICSRHCGTATGGPLDCLGGGHVVPQQDDVTVEPAIASRLQVDGGYTTFARVTLHNSVAITWYRVWRNKRETVFCGPATAI